MTKIVKNDEIDSGGSSATCPATTSARTERSCILAEIARAATLSLLQLINLLPQQRPPFATFCKKSRFVCMNMVLFLLSKRVLQLAARGQKLSQMVSVPSHTLALVRPQLRAQCWKHILPPKVTEGAGAGAAQLEPAQPVERRQSEPCSRAADLQRWRRTHRSQHVDTPARKSRSSGCAIGLPASLLQREQNRHDELGIF